MIGYRALRLCNGFKFRLRIVVIYSEKIARFRKKEEGKITRNLFSNAYVHARWRVNLK